MYRYFISYILKEASEISFKNTEIDWHYWMEDIGVIHDIEEDMLRTMRYDNPSISSITIMNWRRFERKNEK